MIMSENINDVSLETGKESDVSDSAEFCRACNKNEKVIKTSIGGQALLEGIMMRGPKKTAMTVRRPDGTTVTETSDTVLLSSKVKKIPVLRGVFSFVESMIQGYKSLMRSAELAFPEDSEEKVGSALQSAAPESMHEIENSQDPCIESEHEEDQKYEKASYSDERENKEKSNNRPGGESKADNSGKSKEDGALSSGQMTAVMIIGVVLGLGLAIVLFKFLPELIYQLLSKVFKGMVGNTYGHSLLRAAVTGLIKVAILVAYMALVSLMKDIRRTFQYHGAEHKTIFCYEKGLPLTVENVRSQKRFHPRCGTSFLILSVLVSIFVTMFIPAQLVANNVLNVIARTGIGLLLLPVTMGIGYELIKIAGKHDNVLTRVISAPGIWLQHITTREPDDSMIECAILSLQEVIPEDGSDRI